MNSLICPFDNADIERHRHMGLLTEDNKINFSVLQAVAIVHAGLFFDLLHDACGEPDGALSACRSLIELSKIISERQTLLMISIQYDTIAKPLPEVLWWISGNEMLLPPFIKGFMQHLNKLYEAETGQ